MQSPKLCPVCKQPLKPLPRGVIAKNCTNCGCLLAHGGKPSDPEASSHLMGGTQPPTPALLRGATAPVAAAPQPPPPADATSDGILSGLTAPTSAATNCFAFLAPPQQADEIGRLGPYRVLGVIGVGGMGTVFRAEDRVLRRQIALKVILSGLALDATAKARFLREARAQAAIEHDHITTIYQVGEEGDVPFITMPLLKGQTLADAMKANPHVPIGEAIRITREAAEGLAAAHEQNLVHRDIKPANIWLESRHRRVKILDFGLARPQIETDSTPQVTDHGSIVGTPSHMSPEQAQGDPVDARTDLFSLGVVLYQMLTGQQPFAGKNLPATILAVMSRTPTRPTELNPKVPPGLDALTMRLLEKSAKDRPQTALGVVAELQAIELSLNMLGKAPSPSAPDLALDPWKPTAKTDPETELPSSGLVPASLPDTEFVEEPAEIPRKTRWGFILFGLLVVAGVVGGLAVKFIPRTKEAEVTKGSNTPPDRPAVVIPDPEPTRTDPEPKPIDPEPTKVDPEPTKTEPVPKETPLELAPPPTPVFEHRAVAEWVLGMGGVIRVNDLRADIKVIADLPRERFRLTHVWLRNSKVTDEDLAHFKNCRALTYLNLSNTSVSDAGLVYFKECRDLLGLNLSGTQVTDAGLANFQGCQSLIALNLGMTQVTDAGLAHFKDCRGLTYLNLNDTLVTDVGLEFFKDCTGLTYLGLNRTRVSDTGLSLFKGCKLLNRLQLSGTSVGDAGLAHFKDCKPLMQVELQKTRVTAAGVAEFAKALPRCRIDWDGGIVEPKSK